MFMRPTQFVPQFTYDKELGGIADKVFKLAKPGVPVAPKPGIYFGEKVSGVKLGRPRRMSRYEARLQFNDWLQRRFPRVADRARGFGPGALNGVGEETATAAQPKSWWENLLNVAPQVVSATAQYKLIKLNMERAEKGLPPIDTAVAAPTVRVQAEVDPQMKRALYIGGGILAAAALVAALR